MDFLGMTGIYAVVAKNKNSEVLKWVETNLKN